MKPRVIRAAKEQGALTKAEQKTYTALATILADGKEHTSDEVREFVKSTGANWKHVPKIRKILGALIEGGGKAGPTTYRLQGAAFAEQNPAIAKSSEVLQKKTGTDARNLRQKLDESVPGYDPLVSMAQIAQDSTVPLAIRLEIHQTLAKYLVPQIKAAEITTNDQPIALSFKWKN